MKKTHKIIGALLAFVMLLGVIPATHIFAEAEGARLEVMFPNVIIGEDLPELSEGDIVFEIYVYAYGYGYYNDFYAPCDKDGECAFTLEFDREGMYYVSVSFAYDSSGVYMPGVITGKYFNVNVVEDDEHNLVIDKVIYDGEGTLEEYLSIDVYYVPDGFGSLTLKKLVSGTDVTEEDLTTGFIFNLRFSGITLNQWDEFVMDDEYVIEKDFQPYAMKNVPPDDDDEIVPNDDTVYGEGYITLSLMHSESFTISNIPFRTLFTIMEDIPYDEETGGYLYYPKLHGAVISENFETIATVMDFIREESREIVYENVRGGEVVAFDMTYKILNEGTTNPAETFYFKVVETGFEPDESMEPDYRKGAKTRVMPDLPLMDGAGENGVDAGAVASVSFAEGEATMAGALKSFDVVLPRYSEFEEYGTYTYKLRQINNGRLGVTYDETEIELKVVHRFVMGSEVFDVSADVKGLSNLYEAGALKIYNVIDGENPDANAEFVFDVVFTNGTNNTVQIKAGNNTVSVKPGNNNVNTIMLKHGEDFTFSELPYGLEFYYYVKSAPEGYTVSYSDDVQGGTINAALTELTATQTPPEPEIEYASVSVTKVWVGEGEHPTSVFVRIYQNGDEYGEPVELNEDNDWSCEWTELDPDFEWTVDEEDVPEGYIKSVANDGNVWTITNTVKAPEYNSISVKVTKVWSGEGTHPASVLAQLYRNGEAFDEPVELNKDNGWSYEWLDLTDEYTWTVDEVNVPDGYTKSVTNDGTEWTITNTAKPQEAPDDPVPDAPETGDGTRAALWLALAAGSAAVAALAFLLKRKKRARV